jgi:hypothetical protein
MKVEKKQNPWLPTGTRIGWNGMEWDGMKKESKGRNQIQQGDNNLKKTK